MAASTTSPGLDGSGWRPLGCVLGAWVLACAAAQADESVVNSPHDLSARAPGQVRAVHETEVRIFCHTPHNGAPQVPLWNRADPPRHYRIYESSSTDARIDQPGGSSKMCLSCHDGSMALGNVLSRPNTQPIVMTALTIPPGNSDLTNDLSDDHPIGFRYDRALSNLDLQIRDPEVVSRELPLGVHGEMECSTCHDPHDNELGDFLRMGDRYSAICTTCHDMLGWDISAHALSWKPTTDRLLDPTERMKYRSVRDNACASCHKIHSARNRKRLLRDVRLDQNCLACHSGQLAAFNIAAQIRKRSAHFGFLSSLHDPEEEIFTMLPHAACVDCHNPHASLPNPIGVVNGTLGQLVAGPSTGVPGITIGGQSISVSVFGYQVCFRCHSERVFRRRAQTRQLPQTNTRLQFQTGNPSFHPVVAARNNPEVPSLIPPYTPASIVSCQDCHNSDNSRFFGGFGANGPHGSIYEPILVRQYETADFTMESPQAYALCYGCHSRESILGNESFSLHNIHVAQAQSPCSACHVSHGVWRGQGNPVNNSSLINFDTSIVFPAQTAGGPTLQYVDTGSYQGNCTLLCHGVTHVNFPYVGGPTGRSTSSPAGTRSSQSTYDRRSRSRVPTITRSRSRGDRR